MITNFKFILLRTREKYVKILLKTLNFCDLFIAASDKGCIF